VQADEPGPCINLAGNNFLLSKVSALWGNLFYIVHVFIYCGILINTISSIFFAIAVILISIIYCEIFAGQPILNYFHTVTDAARHSAQPITYL